MIRRRQVLQGQPKACCSRCPWRNWGGDDVSLTVDGRLFHTVGAETQKVRAKVTVLVGGTVSNIELDDRREWVGWYWLICWRRYDGCLCSRTLYVRAASLYSTRLVTGNQCNALSSGWDEQQCSALHTSLASEFCIRCGLNGTLSKNIPSDIQHLWEFACQLQHIQFVLYMLINVAYHDPIEALLAHSALKPALESCQCTKWMFHSARGDGAGKQLLDEMFYSIK